MTVIKVAFVLLLLIPVAVLMIWLLNMLRADVPSMDELSAEDAGSRRSRKTIRKERRAQEKLERQREKEQKQAEKQKKRAEKQKKKGRRPSGKKTDPGSRQPDTQPVSSGTAGRRGAQPSAGAARHRLEQPVSAANAGTAHRAGQEDDGLRHPQELRRSERVPFEQSLSPFSNREGTAPGTNGTVPFPTGASRRSGGTDPAGASRRGQAGNASAAVGRGGSEGASGAAETAESGRRASSKTPRSEKRPSKRQLRKNRERARKRDLQKRKRDQ